jgi:hypothetical protein
MESSRSWGSCDYAKRVRATTWLAILVSIASCLGVGCGTDDSGSGLPTAGTDGSDQLVEANVTGRCPGRPIKRKAATFSVEVENTGDRTWPAVFVEWNGIQDVSTPANGGEAVDGSGKTGRYAGGRGYTTYRFSELRPGEAQSYKLTVSPIHKLNRSDVTFAAWGDTPQAEAVPRSPEIAIHPCPGPWGDGR